MLTFVHWSIFYDGCFKKPNQTILTSASSQGCHLLTVFSHSILDFPAFRYDKVFLLKSRHFYSIRDWILFGEGENAPSFLPVEVEVLLLFSASMDMELGEAPCYGWEHIRFRFPTNTLLIPNWMDKAEMATWLLLPLSGGENIFIWPPLTPPREEGKGASLPPGGLSVLVPQTDSLDMGEEVLNN